MFNPGPQDIVASVNTLSCTMRFLGKGTAKSPHDDVYVLRLQHRFNKEEAHYHIQIIPVCTRIFRPKELKDDLLYGFDLLFSNREVIAKFGALQHPPSIEYAMIRHRVFQFLQAMPEDA